MSHTQANRNIGINTPLGEDVLLLKSFSGKETLGRLFQFDLELQSENAEIKFDDIVGQNATVRLNLSPAKSRYFNGYISRFSQIQSTGRLAHYRATMVPWLWFLTRSADCRIFQEMKVPEIIQKVFREHGFTDFKESLSGQFRKWDYCVQYRETDFNFASRLMEQEGIYYFFEHENGKHTLVLADSKSAHQPYPDYGTIAYRMQDQAGLDQEYVFDWTNGKEVQPGLYCHTDFNFEKPKVKLVSKSAISRSHAGASFEVFDYPGEYAEYSEGETYARLRIEEYQAQHETAHAAARARGLAVGCLFTLSGHPRPDQNREYLVAAVSHQATTDDYDAQKSKADEESYSCHFTATSSDEPFRAARFTPKPVVQGPQTAIVVGPSGEEIHTDKYGRVKVLFHWDRYGKADENSSCWIRVSQEWAGKKWGAIYLPRIGQEVIVEFLEGDPDHPIITGRVYNAEAMPPYPLPDQKTISTLKSNSSKDGSGFNEIRFEDKKGKEQVFIHAERNQDIRVKSNTFESIGNERHLTVKKDQLEKVEGDKHQTVKGNGTAKIEGEQHLQVGADRFVHLGGINGGAGHDHLTTDGDQIIQIGGEQDVHVKKDLKEKVDGGYSLTVGGDLQGKVGMKHAMEAGQEIHLKSGMKIILEAGVQLTLKGPGGFVDIGPAGVTIQGILVNINSGGAAGVGSGSSPQSPKDPDPPEKPKEPQAAATAQPGQVDQAPAAPQPPKPVVYSASAKVMQQAAQDGTPFCEKCESANKQPTAGATP